MIGKDRIFIIAEAGVNHNGSVDLAKKMIDAAKWAGADAIKFQTWKTENVVTVSAGKPTYQKRNHQLVSETQYDMLRKLELSYADFSSLKEYCDIKKILFLSTADEIESAMFLNSLQSFFKVGSAELTDWPFLRKLARFGKPIVLSTGMAEMQEIAKAINVLTNEGLPKEFITVLHATTAYPTPLDTANLRAILTIQREFDVQIGYSDHTLGVEAAVAAAAIGSRIIEKHFTLDRNAIGPDHFASIEPPEFQKMVEYIRNVELAMGDGLKTPTSVEKQNMPYVRKSIVARKPIRKGDILTEENIMVKRPGTGISPIYWDRVINLTATKNYNIDDFISEPINNTIEG